MKKIILLLTAVFVLNATYATTYPVHPTLKASEMFFPVGKTGKTISLMDLSQISVKDFQTLTGRKMNFLDRLSFKMAQKNVRNSIDEDGTINSKRLEKFAKKFGGNGDTGFHLGGFALGFFVGPIGVLIAYLINDDYKKNRVKWAWIGLGVFIVLYSILVFAVINSIN